MRNSFGIVKAIKRDVPPRDETLAKSAFGELLVARLTPIFSIRFDYDHPTSGINPNYVNKITTGDGVITQSEGKAVLRVISVGSCVIKSKAHIRYNPGIGALCRFTALFVKVSPTGGIDDVCHIGFGSADNWLQFGFIGGVFGIIVTRNLVINFIPQTSWNIDKMDGKGLSGMLLNTTLGNVYQVKFQWLGFGQISFYIENQVTGNLVPVHSIKYSNNNNEVSVLLPSFQFDLHVDNKSSGDEYILQCPSIGVFVEGQLSNFGPIFSSGVSISTVTDSQDLIAIRSGDANNLVFGTQINTVRTVILNVSAALDAVKNAVLQMIKDPIITAGVYSDVDNDRSIIQENSTGVISGGKKIFEFGMNKQSTFDKELVNFSIVLEPSEILAFVLVISAVNYDFSLAITWRELQ